MSPKPYWKIAMVASLVVFIVCAVTLVVGFLGSKGVTIL